MATIHTTATSAKAWSPDTQAHAPEDVIPDALLIQTATHSGTVEGDAPAVRVTFVTDDDAQFTAEGAEIDVADDELDEVLVYTGKITKLVKVSREQYYQDQTAGRLSTSVARAVTRKANAAYLSQPKPTSPDTTPPAGLLNVTGIKSGDAVATDLDASSTSSPRSRVTAPPRRTSCSTRSGGPACASSRPPPPRPPAS